MRSQTAPVAFLASITLIAFFGCARPTPTAPGDSRSTAAAKAQLAGPALQGAFYPLAIGNRWVTATEDHFTVTSLSGQVVEDFTIHTDTRLGLIGTEDRYGRSYVLEESDATQSDRADTIMSWIRYRQDATGLYEADIATSVPPGAEDPYGPPTRSSLASTPPAPVLGSTDRERAAYRAAWDRLQERIAVVRGLLHSGIGADQGGPPGGVLSNEITRLGYPLRPGATWTIRPDPFFASTVEALDVMDVPAGTFPAYRIRIDSEFFHNGERVLIWMSRSGEIAESYHLTSTATDVDGNTIGYLTDDYRLELQSLLLVKP